MSDARCKAPSQAWAAENGPDAPKSALTPFRDSCTVFFGVEELPTSELCGVPPAYNRTFPSALLMASLSRSSLSIGGRWKGLQLYEQ